MTPHGQATDGKKVVRRKPESLRIRAVSPSFVDPDGFKFTIASDG